MINAGFKNVNIVTKDVSDEYAQKWGIKYDIKSYVDSSIQIAFK
jgi:hypothetical protein